MKKFCNEIIECLVRSKKLVRIVKFLFEVYNDGRYKVVRIFGLKIKARRNIPLFEHKIFSLFTLSVIARSALARCSNREPLAIQGKIFGLQKRGVPCVSVIVPVYNVERYLSECLDSAINQTLKNIEIICVNDGSTDGSLNVLQEYAKQDKRIKIIDKPNGGYGQTMNVGIQAAKGEYIAFLDSDDFIQSDAYYTLYAKASRQNADIIKAGCYFVYSTKKSYIKVRKPVINDKSLLDIILDPTTDKKLFYARMENVLGLFKRKFIIKNDIKHNETPGAAHQDLGFYIQTMAFAKKVLFIDEYFYCYRQERQDSSINNFNCYDYMAKEYEFAFDKIRLKKNTEKCSDVYWHRRFSRSAWMLTMLKDEIKLEGTRERSKQFAKARDLGKLDVSRFSNQQKQDLHLLITAPDAYYTTKLKLKTTLFDLQKTKKALNPTVSVIIPVYNSEKFLSDCLNSVINQTLGNIEIICIDDGSADASLEILKDFAKIDERIIIIEQENAGAGAARNKGLETAKGKYLSFLDADDLFEENMLESAVIACQNAKADFCVFRSDAFYNEDSQKYIKRAWTLKKEQLPNKNFFSYKDISGNIFKVMLGWAWDKLYLADFIKDNSILFQPLRRTNDLLFVFEALLKAERIVAVDKELVHKKLVNSKELTNKEDLYYNNFLQALYALKNLMEQMDIYDNKQQDFINYVLSHSLWHLSISKNETFIKLFNELKTKFLLELNIFDKPQSYFEDNKEYEKLLAIKNGSAQEFKDKYYPDKV
jgi:glycosyltransferase involved in cell wall biosynthesis